MSKIISEERNPLAWTTADNLVALFNYGSMHRREIIADMKDCSEHVELRTAPNERTWFRDEGCNLVEFTGI